MQLRAQLTRSASAQPIRSPGLAASSTAQLESLSATGNATQEIDLTRLVSAAHAHVVSDTITTVTAFGRSHRTATRQEADATFTPR